MLEPVVVGDYAGLGHGGVLAPMRRPWTAPIRTIKSLPALGEKKHLAYFTHVDSSECCYVETFSEHGAVLYDLNLTPCTEQMQTA